MLIYEARKSAKQAMLYGTRHHNYETERQNLIQFFYSKTEIANSALTLSTYEDILAPERFRSIKNSTICLITVTSRAAIDCGMDSEFSFALSDYYINMVEICPSEAVLNELVFELMQNYRELVQASQRQKYSRTVAKAIQFINQMVFERCKVKDVAKAVGVHPNYLVTLFKRELNCSVINYILKTKIEEAKILIRQLNNSVLETAEVLGFSSVSHFSAAFKKITGTTPSHYSNSN